LDTPKLLTDNTEEVVWRSVREAFGEMTPDENPDGDANSITLNIRFPGQYYDQESGDHSNYFRTYSPQLGRYLQSDFIGLEGGLNSYIYVDDNPIIFADPFGLQAMRPINRWYPDNWSRPKRPNSDRDARRDAKDRDRNKESWCAPYCDQIPPPPPEPVCYKVCKDNSQFCPTPPPDGLPLPDPDCYLVCDKPPFVR